MLLATANPVTGMSSGSRSSSSLSSEPSLSEPPPPPSERNEPESEYKLAARPFAGDPARERPERGVTGRSYELRPRAATDDVSAGEGAMGGMVMAGCAMARPEAARAEARPPAAVGFRGVPRPGTGADAEGAAATVAERGMPGVDVLALSGVLALDVRRQGLRLAFALPTDLMDAASELSGTCSVENVGAVELMGMSAIVGMSCESAIPVGDSTRAGGVGGAEMERSCRAEDDGCGLGSGAGSREGSIILSLLRRDLLEAW